MMLGSKVMSMGAFAWAVSVSCFVLSNVRAESSDSGAAKGAGRPRHVSLPRSVPGGQARDAVEEAVVLGLLDVLTVGGIGVVQHALVTDRWVGQLGAAALTMMVIACCRVTSS